MIATFTTESGECLEVSWENGDPPTTVMIGGLTYYNSVAVESIQSQTEKAFNILSKACKDPEYAWSLHSNIACPIMDGGVSHLVANKAAAKVMKQILNVDMRENRFYMLAVPEPT